jgi:hypothetical protein
MSQYGVYEGMSVGREKCLSSMLSANRMFASGCMEGIMVVVRGAGQRRSMIEGIQACVTV